jgi:predicted alpha/beta superfamily hydrolase
MNKNMKQTLLCILFITNCLIAIGQLTLRVTSIPFNTPAADKIYVVGNFNNWNPADTSKILQRQNDGTYQVTFTPNGSNLEYKFTRGSWSTVEGDANGQFRPNRTLIWNGNVQNEALTIQSWEGMGQNSTAAANVRLLSNTFNMPQLGRNRRIWIYLPPDYNTAVNKRYPVFYLQDGQNLFDIATSFAGEWQVDETLNSLFNSGDAGCIVVGIDNGGGSRINEYAAWRNPTYGGGEGKIYARFLVETLKPHIDANFRTKTDRLNTAIGGSSMGGLISLYAAMEYQDVFSKAAIFSPSLFFHDSVYIHPQARGRQQPMRFYFLAGQNESATLVNDVNRMTTLLRNAGFTTEEVKSVVKSDGAHAEWFWAREFSAGYQWLFRQSTALSEARWNDQIRFIPNPTNSILRIETNENLNDINIEIYNIVGQLIVSRPLNANYAIDVNHLKPNSYVIKGRRGSELLFVKQFIKQ